ncbi:MAG TPA: stage II sporulation protein M [Kiritimatiellia bacterium]
MQFGGKVFDRSRPTGDDDGTNVPMILDLKKFVEKERPVWTELEGRLTALEEDPLAQLDLEGIQRLHYLYERTCSDLARIGSFAAEMEMRGYLESLVARAYSELHESRDSRTRLHPLRWFFGTFPRAVRRHAGCLRLSVGACVAGMLFGAAAVLIDPHAKETLLPFGHLGGDPSERVSMEEDTGDLDRLEGEKAAFSSWLMTHNIQVSIFAAALGVTWGVGTLVMMFYNGVILGAVCADYVRAGESVFLVGWLLPHGSVEIPSILLAGQAGLLLAVALIGRGSRMQLRMRMRQVLPDFVTLLGGTACLLVWAGLVEAFFSQYHEPALPYALKIALGAIELVLVVLFFSRSGLGTEQTPTADGHG